MLLHLAQQRLLPAALQDGARAPQADAAVGEAAGDDAELVGVRRAVHGEESVMQ
jgi:hypothetical protein